MEMKNLADPGLSGDLVKRLGGGTLTIANLLDHVAGLMVKARDFKNLSGAEKKMAVITAIKEVAKDIPEEVLDVLVPEAIDMFCSFAQGADIFATAKAGCCGKK